MLRNLQKSVEEEEQVWKAKLTASEEELQKVSVGDTPGFGAPGAGFPGEGDLLAINCLVALSVLASCEHRDTGTFFSPQIYPSCHQAS